ncbi:unnamed protein product, partial [Mesorhabditis spiculigera]
MRAEGRRRRNGRAAQCRLLGRGVFHQSGQMSHEGVRIPNSRVETSAEEAAARHAGILEEIRADLEAIANLKRLVDEHALGVALHRGLVAAETEEMQKMDERIAVLEQMEFTERQAGGSDVEEDAQSDELDDKFTPKEPNAQLVQQQLAVEVKSYPIDELVNEANENQVYGSMKRAIDGEGADELLEKGKKRDEAARMAAGVEPGFDELAIIGLNFGEALKAESQVLHSPAIGLINEALRRLQRNLDRLTENLSGFKSKNDLMTTAFDTRKKRLDELERKLKLRHPNLGVLPTIDTSLAIDEDGTISFKPE